MATAFDDEEVSPEELDEVLGGEELDEEEDEDL